jgi:hypothetical protein
VRGLGFENWRDHVISHKTFLPVSALLSRAGELPVILDVGAYHGEYAKIARRYSPRGHDAETLRKFGGVLRARQQRVNLRKEDG